MRRRMIKMKEITYAMAMLPVIVKIPTRMAMVVDCPKPEMISRLRYRRQRTVPVLLRSVS
jgi:hypothetical protein